PCQGRGREFESRFPLQIATEPRSSGVLFFRGSGSTPGSRTRRRRAARAAPEQPGRLQSRSHRPGGRVVMQRTANPCTPVRFRPRPPCWCETSGFLPEFRENGRGRAAPRFPAPPLRYVAVGTSLCQVGCVGAWSWRNIGLPARVSRKRPRQSRGRFPTPPLRCVVVGTSLCQGASSMRGRGETSGFLPEFRENGRGRAAPRFPAPPLRYVAVGTSLCQVGCVGAWSWRNTGLPARVSRKRPRRSRGTFPDFSTL